MTSAVRSRSTRRVFWSPEDIAALDWPPRLVYIGLWSYVDDNGVGRDIERLIVTELFPLDDDLSESSVRVHGALKHLETHGQITRYKVDGKPYLHITAWETHQKINRPTAGRYPLPDAENSEPHEPLTEPSVSPPAITPLGEGEKGRRGEGEKGTPRTRGTRIPENFRPSDKAIEWAITDCPDVDLWKQTAAFTDHFRAAPGQKGVKLDWDATWRNWMRRQQEWADEKKPKGAAAATQDVIWGGGAA